MPYEEVGNAAVGYAQNASDAGSSGFGGRRGGGGGRSDPMSTAMAVLCCPCFIGFIMTIVGISHLSDATVDTRGAQLQVWHDKMATWQGTGLNGFKAKAYTVTVTHTPHFPMTDSSPLGPNIRDRSNIAMR